LRKNAISTRSFAALGGALALTASLFVVAPVSAEPEVTRKDVEDAYHRAEDANERVNGLVADQQRLKRRVKEASAEIAALTRVYNVQRDELGSAIVQQHLEQPLGPTVSLLSSSDSSAFIEGLSAIDALNTNRADALESFDKTRVSLEKRRDQLAKHQAELKKAKKKADKERATMLKEFRKAQADFERLNPQIQAAMNEGDYTPIENAGSGAAKQAIAFAMKQLGDPYVYGATGPNKWDCSGLVLRAYGSAGVSLPRTARQQVGATRRISRSELRPGDLVAYSGLGHIGIYLGNGKVVHAPRPGKRVQIMGLNGYSVFTRVGG
jgi:cell wall-associated NlpC family hydrolase